jgi:class 3 adenylate cyclase
MATSSLTDPGALVTHLAHRMTAMRESGRFTGQVLDSFASWVVDAPDEDLFRVNPFNYAASSGVPPIDAIDLFVHAARAGIFDFAWGLVCPSCSAFIATRGGLKSLERRRVCGMCGVRAGAQLDDLVEVSFTINAGIRRIRFHGNWLEGHQTKDELAADAARVYFSGLSDMDAVRTTIRTRTRGIGVAPQDRPVEMRLELSEGGDWRVLAPSVHAVCRLSRDPAGPSAVTIEVLDGFVVPAEIAVAPGPVTVSVKNRTDERELLIHALCLEEHHDAGEVEGDGEPSVCARPILSGKKILSTQSFRELFRAETLSPEASLEIRNLVFLFTDLKSSTQLYDDIGDLAALGLVRTHFDVLRDVIAKRGGAVVKTIGDAVMATFVDCHSAVAAALEMHEKLAASPDASALELKVGIHNGPCVAIDSNGRVDYFGQTVNIAARVQALADGRELVCTEAVLRDPGAGAVLGLAGVHAVPEEAQLKGVSLAVRVHRARALPLVTPSRASSA